MGGSLPFLGKFLVPRLQPDHLLRERLLNRLLAEERKRLLLLSAPPGYGKTTLLAHLARHTCTPLVWYQLDAADNDPGLFLQCLVAALRTRFPSVGRATMAMLEDPTQPSERSLAVLLNETVALEKDILLVLEDYHSIHHP
ncbi:MAG: hypothetical protein ACPL88_11945, partial [Bryobacteraceae bacterium]